MRRRSLLGAALASPIALQPFDGGAGRPGSSASAEAPVLPLGAASAFDAQTVIDRARAAAAQPYEAPIDGPAVLDQVTYDVYQQIGFDLDRSLWLGEARYPVAFFHLHRFARTPVRIHIVEGAHSRPLLYDPTLFAIPDGALAAALPSDLGYAGFRILAPSLETDWLAFLGASYFRAAGAENQYGLSARGIAVNTATEFGEEFPAFTEFWLVKPPPGSDRLQIHALLDGPSVAGAFSFDVAYGPEGTGVVMDVATALFARAEITRLGVAPMTSMFWYAEHNRHQAGDWRPEIHDSDGLALWTGADERLWRPLNNPRHLQVNAFLDVDPAGFGLMQRDRDFASYQDDGVFYERRPSLWVEPLDPWGGGAVELVEIPTDDEIYDNIVAFWRPDATVGEGDHLAIRYRLHWVSQEPYPARSLARVVATRVGPGGRPGLPRPEDVTRFVIDFEGGALDTLLNTDDVEPVVTASAGEIVYAYALPVVDTPQWRAVFDLRLVGEGPIDLDCRLTIADRSLTERWMFQYFPFRFDI